MNKSAIIRADGSTELGHGHIFRTLALAKELIRCGWTVTYVCRDLKGLPLSRIEGAGIETKLLDGDLQEKDDTAQTIAISSRSNASWVIIDRYATTADSHREFRNAGLKVLAIDDLCKQPFLVDVLVNQNVNATSFEYQTIATTRKLLGTRYVLLRSAYGDARPNQPKKIKRVKRILVFMGGGDKDDATGKVLSALGGIEGDYIIDTVIGAAYGFNDRLEQMVKQIDHRVKIYRDLPDLVDVMKSADVLISAGGSVTWEACCLGLPMIALPIADNQMEVAQYLHSRGTLTFLGRAADLCATELRAKIGAILLDIEKVRGSGEYAWHLVDGNGVQRVREALDLSSCEEGEA